MSKKIILSTIIVVLIFFAIWHTFLKKEKAAFNTVQVKRGDISQEVSETGQVKKGEEIDLSFKNAGKIEKIYVEVGQKVKEGDLLAKLETSQAQIQLQEARANLGIAKAKLDKLLAGASPEKIKKAKTQVSNAETSLKNAQQNLKDVKIKAEESLKEVYEDALNVLDDSYLKIYNALNTVDLIQRTYFTKNDQEGIKVRDDRAQIKKAQKEVKSYLDAARADSEQEKIDIALSKMKKALDETYDALGTIREVCEVPNYRDVVSSTNKTSLDNHRVYINTCLTNVTNSQQAISLTKVTNQANINSAQSKVSSAKGNLELAKDALSLLTAPPRKEDIDLYKAQVEQAQAQIKLLEDRIEQAVLESPVKGQVIKINKEVGEQVEPMLRDSVLSLLPEAPFEITVDIYEEDIVKMKVGNLVDISLVAFPKKVFQGKIVSIEPAEKLKEGVVYYKTTIDFEGAPPKGVKPGMSADLVIKTALKKDVLILPQKAVKKKNGKTFVEVLKNKKIEEREIKTGILGSDDQIEVISGLKEGEKVIID